MDKAINVSPVASTRLVASKPPVAPEPHFPPSTRVSGTAAGHPVEGTRPIGKKRLWAGRVVSGLAVAFLLFDSIPKILQLAWVVKASASLGFPAAALTPVGIVLLLCTILYCIPRTAILGAILLTGYLGGAVEANVHMGAPLVSNVLFPIDFAVFVWGGLALRDRRVLRVFDRNL